jgi:Zn-dependent protease with chaperone function
MLYTLFLIIAVLYNIRKFSKEKAVFLNSLTTAATTQHQEMILSHHFHIFIFEAFLGFIVSHLISEGTFVFGLLGFGAIYVLLLGFGLFLYQYFLKFVERATGLVLRKSFNQHLIKELRVSFALILLPILLYSLINWAFQSESPTEGGSLWILEIFTNIIFVSVLTISCTVIIMLRLLPNLEVTEPEYLSVINHRLSQIGMPKLRVKWIETDIKNAFVVGLKLLRFSNQTMFIGRNLRTMLTMEEFDAVIAHELAHVANRHIHKRVIELLKNFISAFMGIGLLMLIVLGFFHLYFGEDMGLYEKPVTVVCTLACIGWLFFNYSLFFDTIRSHEYEADAYAVLEMGASFPALKSALEKLSRTDEMPEYLKSKTRSQKKKNRFTRLFSTHPDLVDRINSLKNKIDQGLAFNYYLSTPKKIRSSLGFFFQWKVTAPIAVSFIVFAIWCTFTIKEGARFVQFIHDQSPNEILSNHLLTRKINSKPYLIGKSLMYYIVQKQNPELIDHYLKHGADPGRTLIYLSETKNFDLFRAYYQSLSLKINHDEYYLVLLRSADVNFTEGYRYLVNSSQFDTLNSDYKADLARMHKPTSATDRRPASTIKE